MRGSLRDDFPYHAANGSASRIAMRKATTYKTQRDTRVTRCHAKAGGHVNCPSFFPFARRRLDFFERLLGRPGQHVPGRRKTRAMTWAIPDLSLNEKVKSKTCPAMKGLIKEGSEMMDDLKDSSALDAGLIAAAQKVEHYEIASYGTVIAWAEQMGHDEAAQLLQETLDEEKAADVKLTEIATSVANHE